MGFLFLFLKFKNHLGGQMMGGEIRASKQRWFSPPWMHGGEGGGGGGVKKKKKKKKKKPRVVL
jgi:hypothetical protein